MTAVLTIAGYGFREALRRKVFAVVLVLTALFLALLWVACHFTFNNLEGLSTHGFIDARSFAGSTLLGLCMFGTLFLGAVLAVFLTLGTVRGDAERGLLQPLIVRPVSRPTFLLARWLGAVGVCTPYVVLVYAGAMVITGLTGHWWPDHIVVPAIELAGGVAIVAALSLLGSVFLTSTANGIAIFMIFGAGLVAGLLGQIGEALNSDSLNTIANVASWALPFEALYQDALNRITADTQGFTKVALSLGPFGGAQPAGDWLFPYVLVYMGALAVVGLAGFNRKDL